jgi:hypothetical protein
MDLKNAAEGKILVYNNLGALVKSSEITASNGISVYTMNINELSSGMYTVKIQTNDGFATRKFTKK